jgi:hypothetical protein
MHGLYEKCHIRETLLLFGIGLHPYNINILTNARPPTEQKFHTLRRQVESQNAHRPIAAVSYAATEQYNESYLSSNNGFVS